MTTTYERRYERRDSAANWSTANPTLGAGEWGYDTTNKVAKIGDGVTAWSLLPVYGLPRFSFVRAAETPAAAVPLTTPVTKAGSGWTFFADTLRVGTHLRIIVGLTCSATAQTLTPTLKFGTLNTNADADLIGATALGAGTAAAGSMTCVYDFHVLTATTVMATALFINANVTGITNADLQSRGSAGPITVSNIATTAFFLAPYFVSATASAVTIRSVTYEVVQL